MKKLFLFIILLTCFSCEEPFSTNELKSAKEVKSSSFVLEYQIPYHGDCNGHKTRVSKYEFEDNGHDMIIYHIGTTDSVIHSPDCSKCNKSETKSVLDTPSSDYWGW